MRSCKRTIYCQAGFKLFSRNSRLVTCQRVCPVRKRGKQSLSKICLTSFVSAEILTESLRCSTETRDDYGRAYLSCWLRQQGSHRTALCSRRFYHHSRTRHHTSTRSRYIWTSSCTRIRWCHTEPQL